MECTQVLDSIVEQIENSPGKDIILDASRVKYIDTPGFRWITDHFRKIQELGGQLVVVGLKGPAERAFRLLQLDRFIPSATNVDAALARIRKKG
jgi:anti-anti-sigma factor